MGTDHKTTLRDRGTGSDKTRGLFASRNLSQLIHVPLKQGGDWGERSHASGDYGSRLFSRCSATGNKTAGDCGFRGAAIINEPTAAALAYDVRSDETEQVLVYDLGWRSDVSVVEICRRVTEVLARHGSNPGWSDDFDRRLQLRTGRTIPPAPRRCSPR